MELDKRIKVINTQSAVGFDPRTLQATHNVQVEFNVGTHGPYRVTCTEADFTSGAWVDQVNKYAQSLESAGVIGPYTGA